MTGRVNAVFAGLFLASAIATAAGFVKWLVSEDEDEKVHRVVMQYARLLLEDRDEEAISLAQAALASNESGPLDPAWLPFVRGFESNYERLPYYERILAADPEREETYMEIADCLKFAPEIFHTEVQPRFFAALKAIPGVRMDLLQKYGLLMQEQSEQPQSLQPPQPPQPRPQ